MPTVNICEVDREWLCVYGMLLVAWIGIKICLLDFLSTNIKMFENVKM